MRWGIHVASSVTDPRVPAFLVVVVVAGIAILNRLGVISDSVAISLAINIVIVVGLFIFIGNSGILSFGHIAFAAIGAYVGAVLTIPVETRSVLQRELPELLQDVAVAPWLAVLLGGATAALFGAILAYPLMRLNGLSASLATFGVLVIVNVVANNWEGMTNGASGIAGVPKSTTVVTSLVAAVIAIVTAYGFQSTSISLRLRATREDEVSAQSLGIRILPERSAAWILSSFIVGVGGALLGQQLGSFGPGAFYLDLTFITLAMLVVGGLTSLSGAVIGTLSVGVVGEVLRQIERGVNLFSWELTAPTGVREVALALAMLAILLLRPRGLTGGREILFGRSPDPPPQDPADSNRADNPVTGDQSANQTKATTKEKQR